LTLVTLLGSLKMNLCVSSMFAFIFYI
jgi:hypothetical protein